MKDWVVLATAIIQAGTAWMLLKKAKEDNKKGTPKRRVGRKRK
ncbi:hypothetical protein [Saccharibacillus sacchari]|uniref:Uncharacterized protein n=1 Tax=Saccharibacillus sacchari TaxID=456493 RepID=A0ACC6PIQ0_9BACL